MAISPLPIVPAGNVLGKCTVWKRLLLTAVTWQMEPFGSLGNERFEYGRTLEIWIAYGPIFFCITGNATTVLANTDTQNATDLPQIVSWDGGHGYLESGEMLRNDWGYDTVNPAGKYVLFDEEGAILRRSESMEAGLEDNYTGTEQVPAVIAFRAQVFDGFTGTIEVALEEQNGIIQTVFLNADNFYEWNLSTGSGTYRIQSVSATAGDLSYVTEFSNMYLNLPEEGLLVQKITVTEVVIENIHAAGEESQAAEKNENPIDEMNVLPQKGQEEETEGILENQAQEVNIVDAVKQKNLLYCSA